MRMEPFLVRTEQRVQLKLALATAPVGKGPRQAVTSRKHPCPGMLMAVLHLDSSAHEEKGPKWHILKAGSRPVLKYILPFWAKGSVYVLCCFFRKLSSYFSKRGKRSCP